MKRIIKHNSIVILFGMLFSLCFSSPVSAQNPAEILDRMENVMRGESNYAEMTMQIKRPRFEREISIRSWMLGREYSMILITAPSRDRGTAFLMRESDIWNYDPRVDRTLRLPSSMMSQAWMGSDFTNDDLVRDSDIIDDFEHTLLRTETYADREAYVIELKPKPGTPIVWGKVLMWICKEAYVQLRVENFDQRGELANTMKLDEIKTFGDRNLPARITVIPANKENEKTVLTYQKLEFDIDVSPGFFTQQNMIRLR